MKSKERILAAMSRKDVDYVPCSIYFNPNLKVEGYDLTQWQDYVRLQMDLDLDPSVAIAFPNKQHPKIKTRVWIEDIETERHPIIYKEYQTPAGSIRMGCRMTPDWPYGEDIIWDDHSTSNIYEPLIKTSDDVEAFRYVHCPPDEESVAIALEKHKELFGLAEKLSISIQCLAGHGLATLMFVMGAQNIVMFAIDHPNAFKRLAKIDSEVNQKRIELLSRTQITFLKRFGGYEQTNFYSPEIFREVVLPLLKNEVQVAKNYEIPIYYRVLTGMTPLLDDIASVGFDCIESGEPHLSDCSLEMWHDAFSGNSCSWAGISTPAILGGISTEDVRKEVRKCFDIFGKKGFILGVTNSIRNHFPWKNTLAMVDEWKKLR